MNQPRENLILIGMPGSGKSTVGPLLAERLSLGYLDTDRLIEAAQGRPLQSIVDTEGYLALRRIEEEILLGLCCSGEVIATGGSAVYSAKAMAHLKTNGYVVFLKVSLALLKERVRDLETRGLARRPGQGLAELLAERHPLYERYADLTVDCDRIGKTEICRRIERWLPDRSA